MSLSMSNADTYRELRVYVKPDNLHGAIDELLGVLGAFSVKIEPLYEASWIDDVEEPDVAEAVTEYVLTGTFGVDESLDNQP